MKSTLTLLFAALTLVACHKKQDNPSNDVGDTTNSVHSKCQQRVTDWTMYQLKGTPQQVEECKYVADANGQFDEENTHSQVIRFDRAGKLLFDESISSAPLTKVERDDKGRIERIEFTDEYDPSFVIVRQYTYGCSGLLSEVVITYGQMGSSHFAYTYTADGELASVLSTHTDSSGHLNQENESFTILERDEQGNWTRMLQRGKVTKSEGDGLGLDEEYHFVLTRSITYF